MSKYILTVDSYGDIRRVTFDLDTRIIRRYIARRHDVRSYDAKGVYHSVNGPAVESSSYSSWYLNGKLHRENGPAIILKNGGEFWWFNGKRHRIGAPAIENVSGYKAWYIHDALHREDGPAVEHPNGDREWWLHGEWMRSEFKKRVYNG